MAEKFTDVITYVLSLSLAAGVIAFAAYKVVTLNGMENPPANLGLNFPAPRKKVIMEDPADADPLTTRSLGRADRQALPAMENGGQHSLELLTVVDGVAFVAVDSEHDKTLVPVTVGSRLPGGFTVSEIQRRDGRWSLVAGKLRLEQNLAPGQ